MLVAVATVACTSSTPPPVVQASAPAGAVIEAPAPAPVDPADEELRARTGFPRPPRGTVPNCGPERRFTVPPVSSRERLVELLRADLRLPGAVVMDERPMLDNFRRPPPTRVENGRRMDGGEVDWGAVRDAIVTREEGGVSYFELTFRPAHCSEYTLTVTNTGFAAYYGCCGK